jgi:simple sugar transport system permease protein
LRTSCPLIFASLGGLFSERAGVINIALEAYLLVGAFLAAVVTLSTGSPWLGLVAASLGTALFSLLYGVFVISARANQIVVGTAMNFLAMGMIPFALKILYGSTGSSPAIPFASRFQYMPLVLVLMAVAGSLFVIKKLPFGQWVSFAGENPDALASAGISVKGVRFAALAVAGLLAGTGGACLSVYLSSGYSRNMAAGRGFIALAALIFGKWRTLPTAMACLFFGFMEAVQIQLQAAQATSIPSQFIQIIPYVTTLVVLAGFVGKARAPKALGTLA